MTFPPAVEATDATPANALAALLIVTVPVEVKFTVPAVTAAAPRLMPPVPEATVSVPVPRLMLPAAALITAPAASVFAFSVRLPFPAEALIELFRKMLPSACRVSVEALFQEIGSMTLMLPVLLPAAPVAFVVMVTFVPLKPIWSAVWMLVGSMK